MQIIWQCLSLIFLMFFQGFCLIKFSDIFRENHTFDLPRRIVSLAGPYKRTSKTCWKNGMKRRVWSWSCGTVRKATVHIPYGCCFLPCLLHFPPAECSVQHRENVFLLVFPSVFFLTLSNKWVYLKNMWFVLAFWRTQVYSYVSLIRSLRWPPWPSSPSQSCWGTLVRPMPWFFWIVTDSLLSCFAGFFALLSTPLPTPLPLIISLAFWDEIFSFAVSISGSDSGTSRSCHCADVHTEA